MVNNWEGRLVIAMTIGCLKMLIGKWGEITEGKRENRKGVIPCIHRITPESLVPERRLELPRACGH